MTSKYPAWLLASWWRHHDHQNPPQRGQSDLPHAEHQHLIHKYNEYVVTIYFWKQIKLDKKSWQIQKEILNKHK